MNDRESGYGNLAVLVRAGSLLSGLPLLGGNEVVCYTDGSEAYSAMLHGIASARRFIGLSTYQFDNDEMGQSFVEALGEAAGRGLIVRVLIDSFGARLHSPTVENELTKRGVTIRLWPSRRSLVPLMVPHYHRKILMIDDSCCFTGGMNIRRQHITRGELPWELQDTHFLIKGPVSGQIRKVVTVYQSRRCGTLSSPSRMNG